MNDPNSETMKMRKALWIKEYVFTNTKTSKGLTAKGWIAHEWRED